MSRACQIGLSHLRGLTSYLGYEDADDSDATMMQENLQQLLILVSRQAIFLMGVHIEGPMS